MRWTSLGGYPVEQHNSPNRGGAMSGHRGAVAHHAEGTYSGTISWQMNPDQRYSDGTSVTTSSTWIVGKNTGEIAQMVDTDEIAWCQRSGSRDWLSIEYAGYHGDPLTAWQIEATALILVRLHEAYGIPIQVANDPSGRGLGHHSMDREWLGEEWGHEDCPGDKTIAQKPAIVARALDILNGDDMADLAAHEVVNALANGSIDKGYVTGKEAPGTPGYGLHVAEHNLRTLGDKLTGIAAAVDELQSRPPVQAAPVDVAALAAALRPQLQAIVREELDALRLGRVS